MRSILFINIVRYLLLALSFIGLACHFAQCTLLRLYQDTTGIPGWFTAGHWQYLAWYISLIMSLLSGLAICAHASCCKRGHLLRGDKCLGIANVASFSISIAVNTLFNDQEPWTNGIVQFKEPSKGLVIHCTMLDAEHDAAYPLLFQRCLLVNSTYTASALICLLWMVLVACTWFLRPKKVSSVGKLPNEKGWKISKNKKHPLTKGTHPYTRKASDSIDNTMFQYQPEHNSRKYKTPIAPHVEKLELPKSYDGYRSHLYNNFDNNTIRPLSRHYSPPYVPGGWVEYNSPPAATSYYY